MDTLNCLIKGFGVYAIIISIHLYWKSREGMRIQKIVDNEALIWICEAVANGYKTVGWGEIYPEDDPEIRAYY